MFPQTHLVSSENLQKKFWKKKLIVLALYLTFSIKIGYVPNGSTYVLTLSIKWCDFVWCDFVIDLKLLLKAAQATEMQTQNCASSTFKVEI